MRDRMAGSRNKMAAEDEIYLENLAEYVLEEDKIVSNMQARERQTIEEPNHR